MEDLHERPDDNRSAEDNNGAEHCPQAEKGTEEAAQESEPNAADSGTETKKIVGSAAARRFRISMKVSAAYFAYLILFLITFAVMLLLLTLAAIGIPTGIIFGVFGVAILLFKADFIITELAPELMIFGGLTVACGTAFCGLLAVKAGFMVSRLFLRIKLRCDRLRGW